MPQYQSNSDDLLGGIEASSFINIFWNDSYFLDEHARHDPPPPPPSPPPPSSSPPSYQVSPQIYQMYWH